MHRFARVHLDSARKSDTFLAPEIETMLLAFFVLFIALCPGVIFTAPSLGKKVSSKLSIAVIHALIFVIVVNLLYVSIDGFQAISATRVRTYFGWTVSSLPPEDPVVTANNLKASVEDYRESLAEEMRQLSIAEEAAAGFEPPGSRTRAKCISVQSTSCPSADGQRRLFGSDDCAKLEGLYHANGECHAPDGNHYSDVCGRILNRLRPVGNQDKTCIAARSNLASAPSTGNILNSLMGPAIVPRVPTCGRNMYYNVQRRSCVPCAVVPALVPEPAWSNTVTSIKKQCSPSTLAWKKVSGMTPSPPTVFNAPVVTVGENMPAVPGIASIASALGMGSSPIASVYGEPVPVPRQPVQIDF